MKKKIKPSWYIQKIDRSKYFRLYVGKTEGEPNGEKYWVFNVGLYFVDFGYAF